MNLPLAAPDADLLTVRFHVRGSAARTQITGGRMVVFCGRATQRISCSAGAFVRDAGLIFGIEVLQKPLKFQPLNTAVADARLYFAAPTLGTIKL
jgi:hypothetical protein